MSLPRSVTAYKTRPCLPGNNLFQLSSVLRTSVTLSFTQILDFPPQHFFTVVTFSGTLSLPSLTPPTLSFWLFSDLQLIPFPWRLWYAFPLCPEDLSTLSSGLLQHVHFSGCCTCKVSFEEMTSSNCKPRSLSAWVHCLASCLAPASNPEENNWMQDTRCSLLMLPW